MCDTTLPLQGTYPIWMSTRYVLLGVFLSCISIPDSSKNICPFQSLFSWILALSSKSVDPSHFLEVISSRKPHMLIQSFAILSSSPKEVNANVISKITPSQTKITSLFSLNIENITLLLIQGDSLCPLSKSEEIIDFLQVMEGNTTSLIGCLHQSIKYQFSVATWLPLSFASLASRLLLSEVA